MSRAFTLHIETCDRHFKGYIEHASGAMPLTEDQFQILVEKLADTAMTADCILHDFVERHEAVKAGGEA